MAGCQEHLVHFLLERIRLYLELVVFGRLKVDREVAADLVEDVFHELFELLLLDRRLIGLAKVGEHELLEFEDEQ